MVDGRSLVMITFLRENRTFISHWLGRIHGRQGLYAFVPILMFFEFVPPTEGFEPRDNPE